MKISNTWSDSVKSEIPFYVMRGGTSKAIFLMKNDLPEIREIRDKIILSILKLPDLKEKFGIGLNSLSSKIAIISKSDSSEIDIDYFFAQGDLNRDLIDTSISCGNILSAVGPFAIETRLVGALGTETKVNVVSVNTNVVSEVIVRTLSGKVCYEGNVHIDGVEGSAAPVLINFLNPEGSTTGKVLPTGNAKDLIESIEVSCIDVAIPVIIANAKDFGKNGNETASELNKDVDLLRKIEIVRCQAGQLMGLGNVAKSVMPKFALVSKPKGDSGICSRYFTPWNAHTSHAVTGALCIAASCNILGSVSMDVFIAPKSNPQNIIIEHPSGIIEVEMEIIIKNGTIKIPKAALVRTADKLYEGIYYAV